MYFLDPIHFALKWFLENRFLPRWKFLQTILNFAQGVFMIPPKHKLFSSQKIKSGQRISTLLLVAYAYINRSVLYVNRVVCKSIVYAFAQLTVWSVGLKMTFLIIIKQIYTSFLRVIFVILLSFNNITSFFGTLIILIKSKQNQVYFFYSFKLNIFFMINYL